MAESTKTPEKEGIQVYELGFHLVPSITSEQATDVWASVHAELKKIDAEVISEEAPQLTDLVYTMEKKVQGKNVRYNSAHFGWVKFATSPENIAAVKVFAETHPDALRSIIIKTVRENTLQGHKFADAAKASVRPVAPKAEEVKPSTEAEVDKAIDNIVAE